ncbi:T9SS type A sorting domain-containing protein [candidate division KSB1 bacterium]|nr:T9SS type A sorting domain-containing protein [candidate division KSB1 bacterium]
MEFEILIDEMSLYGPVDDSFVKEKNVAVHRQFTLHQNYPNPFNPVTQISYSLSELQNVTLNIFNSSGQWITKLIDKQQGPGEYIVQWDGRDNRGSIVSNGIYLCKLECEGFSQTCKMIFMK